METDAAFAITAYPVDPGTDFVPAVRAGRTMLNVDLCLHLAEDLPEDGATLLLRGRELFSGRTTEWEEWVPDLPEGEHRHTLLAEGLALEPGCWHFLAELRTDDRLLTGRRPGSFVVYARGEHESARHARGSYNLARAEFAWDRRYEIYYKTYRSELPPTGDPFDEAHADHFRHEFVLEEATWPELQHDGGLGFLLAGHVFHALGQSDRAAYCEEVMRRTVNVILDKMHLGDGRLASIKAVEEKRVHGRHSRQQDGFALKFLSQVYFYFRFGPGADPDYARSVLERAEPMFRYQIGEPLEAGCGGSGCRVYDGRILAGIAWFCLAWRSEHGQWPKDTHLALHGAAKMTRELLANHNWYDAGCLVENECHIWCGNMNLLNGLLPVRRMIRIEPEIGGHIAPHIERGIRAAFDFLTRTSGTVTGRPAFVPTMTSQWAAGNMYEICDEFLRQVGPDDGVQRLMEHLVLGAGAGIVDCFHRNNTSGAVMMSCPEYEGLDPRPPLPWDNV